LRPAPRAGALLCFCLLVAGCSARFEAFPFQTVEGRRIDIWQPGHGIPWLGGGGPRAQAVFQAPRDKATPLYHLGSTVSPADGQAFALTYVSSVRGAELALYADHATMLKKAPLPPTSGNPVRFLVPLEPGQRVWGFQVNLPAAGELSLQGAGTLPMVHGFSVAGSTLTVDGSVEVRSLSVGATEARLPADTRAEMGSGTWLVTIVLQQGSPGGRVAFDGTQSAHAAFDVDPEVSPRRLDFTQADVGFLPAAIRVLGAVESLQISQVPAGAPIPADLGLILTARRSEWRRSDFELYSWSLFPHVLVFDTATYDVQDGLFNRLAFFVEKAGWVGLIKDPAEYHGIHGYNAHDYRADDLARFFSKAAKESIPLTPLEGVLLKILMENGIVLESGGAYAPGEGSVLSISRSSDPVLRELLLIHESFHGVYFSLPAFRQVTESIWASLLPVEQQVWEEFLSSQKYDIEDKYLVVNEFQAYLLQQPRSAVPGRQALTLSRMRSGSPGGARLAAELQAEAPSSFLHAFDSLDTALRGEGGPPGGLSIGVRPADPAGRAGDF
jgi:hypothetical protein